MAHSSSPPGPGTGAALPQEARDSAPSGADPEKRKRILDASVRTFGRRGFHDARIAEIAAAAKVAEGTVYLYFKNKEDLLGTIFDETMDDLLAQGRQLAATGASAADRITGLVDLHLRVIGSDRDLASLFQIELRRSARLMERVIREKLVDYFRILGGVVKEGIASGELRADLEPRLAVRVLFGAADEILSEWIFSGGAEPVANARKLVGALLRGFASPESAAPGKSKRKPPRRSPRA